jgi:nitrogen fixation protein FixH
MSDTPASKQRNLWPAGIIATFVLFIAGTVGLVVLSARNHVELVSPDYYERELRYQEQIASRERTQALPNQARVSYDAAQGSIVIALPAAQALAAQGRIQLYRPSDARLDREVPLALDGNGIQRLDAKQLHSGLWNVRVQWNVAGEEYFLNRSIVVSPGQS